MANAWPTWIAGWPGLERSEAPVLVVNQIVPEPGSLLLLVLGIVAVLPLALRRLRRRT